MTLWSDALWIITVWLMMISSDVVCIHPCHNLHERHLFTALCGGGPSVWRWRWRGLDASVCVCLLIAVGETAVKCLCIFITRRGLSPALRPLKPRGEDISCQSGGLCVCLCVRVYVCMGVCVNQGYSQYLIGSLSRPTVLEEKRSAYVASHSAITRVLSHGCYIVSTVVAMWCFYHVHSIWSYCFEKEKSLHITIARIKALFLLKQNWKMLWYFTSWHIGWFVIWVLVKVNILGVLEEFMIERNYW